VDDEALLGNEPVMQQWKGSDRCCAVAQYTGANNGVEDAFCGRCGGYITVTTIVRTVQCRTVVRIEQLQSRVVRTEKSQQYRSAVPV
jgi:hypothetical protein